MVEAGKRLGMPSVLKSPQRKILALILAIETLPAAWLAVTLGQVNLSMTRWDDGGVGLATYVTAIGIGLYITATPFLGALVLLTESYRSPRTPIYLISRWILGSAILLHVLLLLALAARLSA